MRIISKKALQDFYNLYPDSKTALENWYKVVKQVEWTCFADVRNTFNSADYVDNKRYVFNIKGNDYRIVAIIQFTIKAVLIRFVGTHQQYDKIEEIENI